MISLQSFPFQCADKEFWVHLLYRFMLIFFNNGHLSFLGSMVGKVREPYRSVKQKIRRNFILLVRKGAARFFLVGRIVLSDMARLAVQ